MRCGLRRHNRNSSSASSTFFQRVSHSAGRCGSQRRNQAPAGSTDGSASIQLGERCSIVTCAAVSAIAGTSVTAVAPLPITTTRLPAWSRSAGQCCGCTSCPAKRSWPGNCGW